jgi:hypothetical protein
MSRFLCINRNLELLEPYEGKLSRTVLRGERGSNVPDLPNNTVYVYNTVNSNLIFENIIIMIFIYSGRIIIICLL